MVLNFTDIIQKQKELDEVIFKKAQRTYNNTFDERKLALVTEIAEFANELRSFKYWSTKGPSEKAIVLDEYVDGIHFLSGFCVMLKVKPLFELKKEVKELSKEDTVKKLLDLVSLVSELDKKEKPNNNAKVVEKAFVKYLALGLGLGYTLADILNAYDQKNQVNHQRQETNY